MLPGRPDFCRLFGLDLENIRSILLFESLLFIGIGVGGFGEGISDVLGELEGLDENVMGRRFFFSRPPPTGALPGSSMGVNGEISGAKILKLFRRLPDMFADHHQ